MARWRRSTAEETAAVPGQRPEPALAPDEGRDDAERTDNRGAGEPREGDGPPAGPVAPTAETSPASSTEAERAEPAPERPQRRAAAPQDHKIHHTRISGTWVAVIAFAVVLLLLLIFILQNGQSVEVSYFGAHGHLPLGVSLLLAAVAGILLVALAGSARIMQLRATARRHRRADAKAAKTQP